MKAVIMAGGKGTRLKELTKGEMPKTLVNVVNKPIIVHQIEKLKENNIFDIILIVGHLKEKIIDFLGNGSKLGVNIEYITEEKPLGTAGSLFFLKEVACDDFLLIFGDIIFDINIEKMYDFHKRKESILTLYAHPSSHAYDSDLIKCDLTGKVKTILKKGDFRPSVYHNLVNASFFIVNPIALKYLQEPHALDMENGFIKLLINNNEPVYAYSYSEYIHDVGTTERIVSTESDLKRGIVQSKNAKNKQKCVFLDRDGTINVYKPFIKDPSEIDLISGVQEAIKLLNKSGYLAIVITNQPVVARGECSFETLDEIHKTIETELGKYGSYVDDILFCPHHPHKGYEGELEELKIECNCRKPKTGMIEQSVDKFNISLEESWIIGDTYSDVLTGRNAGLRTIKLISEIMEECSSELQPNYFAQNLAEAVKIVLQKK